MSSEPHLEVVEWLNTQGSTRVFLSSVTVAEISYGVESLPVRFSALRHTYGTNPQEVPETGPLGLMALYLIQRTLIF